jgi:hypothetical protein
VERSGVLLKYEYEERKIEEDEIMKRGGHEDEVEVGMGDA